MELFYANKRSYNSPSQQAVTVIYLSLACVSYKAACQQATSKGGNRRVAVAGQQQ
jgi:hypothetical protein